jgi:hypothetical protein
MELSPTGTILWQNKSTGLNGPILSGGNEGIAKNADGTFANFGACYGDGRSIAIIDSAGNGYCNAVPSNIISSVPDAFTVIPVTPLLSNPNIQSMTVTNTSTPFTITTTKLCGTLGIENTLRQASLLSVYPNPANDKITLMIGDKPVNNAVVLFWNVLGEKVSVAEMTSSTIDVSGLKAGIYLMEVIVDGERMVQRVIKN